VALAMSVAASAGAAEAADGLQARVMVLPAEGSTAADPRLASDVSVALMRGARRATRNVAQATATLADTAVIVGCDPAERSCADAVAAALNVDQMLLPRLSSDGDVSTVEVTAISREAAPVSRRFPVRPASRRQDLASIEAAVPTLLDAEGHGVDPGPDDPPLRDELPPPPPPDDPPPGGGASGEPPGDGSPRLPMYLTAGGGALAVTGLVFWGLAAARQGDIDDAPTSTAEDLANLEALEDRGRTYATLGNAMVIGGGLVAVAGAVWWWRSRPRGARATVTPVVTPGGGAVMLGGRW
jgi:hypothetical protein